MAILINPTHSNTIELIYDARLNERGDNATGNNTTKINQPTVGNIVLYGASTVGGGSPQPPPSTSTGSGQIFPTGRQ